MANSPRGVDKVVRRLKVTIKIQKNTFVGKQCTFFLRHASKNDFEALFGVEET